jgi:hypothetical protein
MIKIYHRFKFLLHSCWCILLFECGLNSNLNLNSNFVWIRKEIEIRKENPNPQTQPSKPQPKPTSPSPFPHGPHVGPVPRRAAQRPAHLSPSRLAPPASASPHSSRAAPHAPRPPDLPVPPASGTPLALAPSRCAGTPPVGAASAQQARTSASHRPAADQTAPRVSPSLLLPFPAPRNRARDHRRARRDPYPAAIPARPPS